MKGESFLSSVNQAPKPPSGINFVLGSKVAKDSVERRCIQDDEETI